MVVAGDTNSYPQPTIDHLGGPSHIRQNCFANTSLSLGLRDTFRERHLTTRAFSHISKSGGPRVDQLCQVRCRHATRHHQRGPYIGLVNLNKSHVLKHTELATIIILTCFHINHNKLCIRSCVTTCSIPTIHYYLSIHHHKNRPPK